MGLGQADEEGLGYEDDAGLANGGEGANPVSGVLSGGFIPFL